MNRVKALCAVVLTVSGLPGATEGVVSSGGRQTAIYMPEGTAGIQFYGAVTIVKDVVVAVGEHGTVATLTATGAFPGEMKLDLATLGSSALTAVCAWPNGVRVITSQDGAIWRSDDAGTWVLADSLTKKDSIRGGGPLFNCWCGEDGIGLAVGAFGTILRTDDYGRTWSPVSVNDDDDYHLYDICGSQDDVFIVGEAGRIYRSGDLGRNWTVDVSPYNGSIFNATVRADGDILAFGLRGTVLARSAEGNDWRVLSAAGGKEAYFAAIRDGDSVLLGGADGDIDRLRNETIEHVFKLPGRPSVIDLTEVNGFFVVATTDGLSVLKL
jgi:photosystem II stability/assembly factor-like uncharacterized protein